MTYKARAGGYRSSQTRREPGHAEVHKRGESQRVVIPKGESRRPGAHTHELGDKNKVAFSGGGHSNEVVHK